MTAERENNKKYTFSPRNYIGMQWKIVFVISQGRIVHIWANNTSSYNKVFYVISTTDILYIWKYLH